VRSQQAESYKKITGNKLFVELIWGTVTAKFVKGALLNASYRTAHTLAFFRGWLLSETFAILTTNDNHDYKKTRS
jgi:hypothetical protein